MPRLLLLSAFCLACLAGCSGQQTAKPKGPQSAAQAQTKAITLATTTSTQDSGLLDELLPAFTRESGIEVKVVAVGSGQALELGRRGDADVLLVHSPAAEQQFMDEGWGARRLPVMHNDYVIVGPSDDDAQIKAARTASKATAAEDTASEAAASEATAPEALAAIAEHHGAFVSRGDDSGTHKKELELWTAANVGPHGDWYKSAGAGMAQALRIANEKKAYTLSDRGTYLALRDELELVVLFEGDDRLLNRYSVITLNSARHPHLRERDANRFADYLTSPAGQKAIGAFGVERYEQPLFVPDATQRK